MAQPVTRECGGSCHTGGIEFYASEAEKSFDVQVLSGN